MTNKIKSDIALGPVESPYRRFALAELNLQYALLEAKKGRLLASTRLLKQALKLLRDNQKKHPDFVLNNKTLGLLNCYLSTVPDNYKWVSSALGFDGDLDLGLNQLKAISYSTESSAKISAYHKEAGYLYAFVLSHVASKHDQAWNEVKHFSSDYDQSPLSAFFYANIAMKNLNNEEAIEGLKASPRSSAHLELHLLDYMLGSAMLFSLDDGAIFYLERFHEQFNGLNFIKANLQKISWYYLLKEDHQNYSKYKELIKTEGLANNEEDKAALLYANKSKPHIDLLKARLLYDGGYHIRARDLLVPLKHTDFESDMLRAEYCYRKGRVYQALGKINIAKKFYEACALYAKESPEYYGAYACLYLGDIYLNEGEFEQARSWYKKALTFRNNREYTQSVEHKAKQGIKNCSS